MSVINTKKDFNSKRVLLELNFSNIWTDSKLFLIDKYSFPMDPTLMGQIFPYSIVFR